MNNNRCLQASIAAFVVLFALEWVIHGMLLQGVYQQTAAVWRPMAEMQKIMWMMWLGYLIFAPFFTAIFVKGYEKNKPALGQGLRFGVLVGLAFAPMQSLAWYAVLPIPAALAFWWFLAGMVEFIVLGLTVGLIYGRSGAQGAKPRKRKRR